MTDTAELIERVEKIIAVFDSPQAKADIPVADARALLRICKAQSERIAVLEGALEFYADPENYHAIGFAFDRPCGLFEDDFDEDHGHEDYDRPMPGKRARASLTPQEPK